MVNPALDSHVLWRPDRPPLPFDDRTIPLTSAPHQDPADLITGAVTHHRAGRLAEAQALYRRVLEIEPGHADGLHLMGVLAFQVGRADIAADMIGRAISVDGQIARYHQSLGTALAARNRPAEAAASFRRALALDPELVDAHNALGNALGALGRHREAAESYRQALTLAPDVAGLHNNLGNALAAAGRLEEAVDGYRRALALDPGYADAENNLGNTLSGLVRLADAAACYQRVLTARPDHVEAHNNLGTVFRDLGRFDEAAACFERCLALAPGKPEAHNNLGSVLRDLGRAGEAAESYRRALALAPDALDVLANLATALADLGQIDGAAAYLRRCLALDTEDRHGFGLRLAALGAGPLPERVSAAHLETLYDRRAHVWDQRAGGARPYRGAELVARTLGELLGDSGPVDILDAGCGTGLVGTLVVRHARRLDGIDLSPPMLARARHKGLYHALHHGDLVAFMADRPLAYDAVTCAATLIHLRDLGPAFAAAAVTLRDGGLFICTLFPNDDEREGAEVAAGSFRGLVQGGCYVHGRAHVARQAEAAGFTVETLADEIHEYHKGQPAMGLIVALRRRPRERA